MVLGGGTGLIMGGTGFGWRTEDRYAVVEVTGEVDLGTQAQFAEVLDQAGRAGAELVVVDLSGVRFFGVAGLSCLEEASAVLRARGAALHLVCADPGPVWRVLSVLGLTRRWPVHRELAQAVRRARVEPD
jgi:anti-sigma B factor antagonist